MAIAVLLVVVTGAIVLVNLLQNRQDLRGMSDHRRAMDALHKLAGNPSAPGWDPPSAGDDPSPIAPRPIPALELSRIRPAPLRVRARGQWRWRRPALVSALVLLAGGGVAGITTFSSPARDRATTAVRQRPVAAASAAPLPAAVPAPPPTAPAPPVTTLQPASDQTTVLQPAKADARTADYVVGTAPFSVVVTAGGPCWLQVQTATGQLLFSGTMAPGQIQTFDGTDLRIRLGAAGNVTLQVNGSSLAVPVHTPDPYSVRVAQTA